MRRLDLSHGGLVRLAVTVVAVAMVLYHMWVIWAGTPEAIIFRGTHLMFALVLVFLIYGSKVGVQRPIPNVIDYVWLVLGAASVLYLFVNYEYIVTRIYYIDDLTWADMIFGTILIVVVTGGDAPLRRPVAARHLDPVPAVRAVHRQARADAPPRPALHDDGGHLRPGARRLGVVRDHLRGVRQLHGADRRRSAVHGLRHGA